MRPQQNAADHKGLARKERGQDVASMRPQQNAADHQAGGDCLHIAVGFNEAAAKRCGSHAHKTKIP